jgi:glycosyltransferase involved in cell wall biosynthesis
MNDDTTDRLVENRLTQATRLSVVVPAYNEEEVLPEFHRRLSDVLASIPALCEVVYVNDGSSDRTRLVLERLRQDDPSIAVVDFSRNFGKEIALTAGLDHASGDLVIVIDADLQDPPELIPELIERWREGYDVVYAKRTSRAGESWLKRGTAYGFYRVMRWISPISLPEDTGDYRLLSRRAVASLTSIREQHRFMKGLFAWIGYPQAAVPYERDGRFAGKSKWNYWKLWRLSIEGITSFTIGPLKVATYLGLLVAFGAFIYGSFIIYDTMIHGNPVAGYPSLLVVVLFLGGVQLIALGLIGEYLGRVFDEAKDRPLYIVKDYAPPRTSGIGTSDTEGGSPAEEAVVHGQLGG